MQHGAFVKNCAQSDQGRFASVRAELLPPLSPGRASRGGDRYFDKSSWISMRDEETSREIIVSLHDEGGE
jgi:hypothetical protein